MGLTDGKRDEDGKDAECGSTEARRVGTSTTNGAQFARTPITDKPVCLSATNHSIAAATTPA
ncbi:hypothetical protein FRC15_007447 [Serendipita sp. 397]|nr:hypothetical protein FRC15_007447 [Serendipita sp. 397]